MADRFHHLRVALGREVFDKVQEAKILVVGAGGIGCELLKNLALSGFQNVEVIDLDTIDVSNLNRQFLFRKRHVGKSKSQVAHEAVLEFNPDIKNIKSYHGNVKEERFGAEYFKGFTLVMNALDNLDARRHVNRLCLSTNTPLIESGTQGYLGQVTTIKGGVTECFECTPQQTAKTYAVCTIRNTPDKPVHCIVWAKFIYQTLFGPKDDENILSDIKVEEGSDSKEDDKTAAPGTTDDGDDDNNKDKGAAAIAATAVASGTEDATKTAATGEAGDDDEAFAAAVFDRLFYTQVHKDLQVEGRWEKRQKPIPLELSALRAELVKNREGEQQQGSDGVMSSQRVLSIAENAEMFVDTILRIRRERKEDIGQLTFDKDDQLAMDFVTSAANLRMSVFHITTLNAFQIKGIAGNIVHAIATTNAISAGLIVLEGFKILAGRLADCRTTWIKRWGNKVLQPQALDKPDPKCYICGKVSVTVALDTGVFTLKQFYDSVLKKKLGMNDPCIDVDNKDNFVGTEDEHSSSHLCKPLNDVGIKIENAASLVVEDYSQALECRINIVHKADIDELEHPEMFILSGDLPTATAEAEAEAEAAEEAAASSTSAAGADGGSKVTEVISLDDDDDVEEVGAADGAVKQNKKRAPSSPHQHESKKLKVSAVTDDDDDDDIIIL